MRRLIVAAFLLLTIAAPCVAPADGQALRGYEAKQGYHYVALGEYPQDEDGTVRPILWRVLSVEDGEAYLLSEYVLTNGRVHPDDKEYVAFDYAFNKTEVFARLNGEFKEAAFSQEELSRLREDEELGVVFLAASADLKNPAMGFRDDKSRQGFGTPYALANGLFRYGMSGRHSSPYWTRTPSINNETSGAVRCTKVKGNIGYIRCVVENEGIRPAIRLILGDEPFAGGQGTLSEPFYYGR